VSFSRWHKKWRNRFKSTLQYLRYNPMILCCVLFLLCVVVIALLAPYITKDPIIASPQIRLRSPDHENWFGTDSFGRDVFARTMHGTRTSLIVGLGATILATIIGLNIGLVSGYIRIVDAIVMRLMDALMAIPGILLAIALMTLFGASIINVIIAISLAQIPGFARLVRSMVLSLREQPYIEAAVCIGTKLPKILFRHILPNIFAPLIAQMSYAFAAAVIFEAILSFLGAGTPPEIPSWGNMVAEGRLTFFIAPWVIFFPGAYLVFLVIIINLLGDNLRDTLDPRIAKELK